MLNKNIKPFIIYRKFFNFNLMPIHLAQEAQIALLIIKKVKILTKYLNFLDIFLKKKALVLFKTTKLNQ